MDAYSIWISCIHQEVINSLLSKAEKQKNVSSLSLQRPIVKSKNLRKTWKIKLRTRDSRQSESIYKSINKSLYDDLQLGLARPKLIPNSHFIIECINKIYQQVTGPLLSQSRWNRNFHIQITLIQSWSWKFGSIWKV